MVAVYGHNQPLWTKPLEYITRAQRDWWVNEGSGKMQEAPGCTYDRGRVLVLSKPTTDRMESGNSALGTCLIWAYLRGDEEAIAKMEVLRRDLPRHSLIR